MLRGSDLAVQEFLDAQQSMPAYVKHEHLVFLDRLRRRTSLNMFQATPYLELEFGLEPHECAGVLGFWMATYKDRVWHGKDVI